MASLSIGQTQRTSLIEAAFKVRARSYAPYSNFSVGSALLADSGEIFVGCNVENASYGMTICAERVAVSSALAAGEQKFLAMVIASPGGIAPCGACLQVLAEFCSDLLIVRVDIHDRSKVQDTLLSELLPDRFAMDCTTTSD